jgi:stress-induced morphogen
METLMTRVEKILRKEFSPREIRLKAADRGRLEGLIISKSFDKLTDKERQRKVWRLLETNLSAKDRNRILGFFTFTPLDEKWVFDGSYDKFEADLKKKSLAAKKQTIGKRTNGRARTMRKEN